MCARRSSLESEQRKLDTVRLLAARKKDALRGARAKVTKLREQLEAAERIVGATETQIEAHNAQVGHVGLSHVGQTYRDTFSPLYKAENSCVSPRSHRKRDA